MCGEMGMPMHSCISRFDGRAGGPAVNSYVGFYFDAAVVTPQKTHSKKSFPDSLKLAHPAGTLCTSGEVHKGGGSGPKREPLLPNPQILYTIRLHIKSAV